MRLYKRLTLLLLIAFIITIFVLSFQSSLDTFKSSALSSCYGTLDLLKPIRQEPFGFDDTQVFKTPLITPYKCMKRINLLILVTSGPGRFQARQVIRQTWGAPRVVEKHLKSWRTLFLLGQDTNNQTNLLTKKESKLYRDLLIGYYKENFYNLAIKVMMGFEWASKLCVFDYVLKADDDVFVNVPNIFGFLNNNETPRTRLYAGWVHYQANPLRSGKYKVTKKEYPYKKYPRFVAGGGMLLSSDVVDAIVPHFDVDKIFRIDDVFIGMMCLKAGVDATHSDEFRVWQRGPTCLFRTKEIIHHRVDNGECMKKMYHSMHCRNRWSREGRTLRFYSVDRPGTDDLL